MKLNFLFQIGTQTCLLYIKSRFLDSESEL